MFIVYLVTCLVNEKLYVGKTEQTLHERWLQHLSFARCGAKWALSRAIRKYGPDNFTITVITTTGNRNTLSQLEKLWIVVLNSKIENHGYNMTDGGEGVSGRPMSEEAKRRISIANTGKTHSPSTRERLRIAHTGRKLPESQKVKIGNASRGHIKSSETREKLRLANLGKPMPESARRKISEANKLKSGPTASRFNHSVSTEEIDSLRNQGLSTREIAKKLGIDKSTVTDRLEKAGKPVHPGAKKIREQRLRDKGKEHLINPNNSDLEEMLQNGATVKEIGNNYELSPAAVRNRLKKHGITFSKQGSTLERAA
jgi:group I intron endonuclease